MKKNLIFLMLLPGILLLSVFLIFPLFQTVATTFLDEGKGFTLLKYYDFFKDPYYLQIYWRTVKLSLIATFICIILGFPTSYYISQVNKKIRGIYIMFAVFPLLTSAVVRSFGWMVILGKKGIINNLLLSLKIIDSPLSLLYNEFSIIVGLVYLFLPLMIMSLIGVMENIDYDFVEAAESLGASKLKAFIKIVFPLSVPGLIVGSILVFTGSLTAYTTPQLLGENKSKVLSTLIYQSAMSLFDWSTASVVACIMIITTIIISTLINNLAANLNKKR